MRSAFRPRSSYARRTRLLFVAMLFGTLGCEPQPETQRPELPLPSLQIRNQTVLLEFARTRAEQSKGLGGRDLLAWGHGMLFEYDPPGFIGFWMKDMRFDIDIVWIREQRIVDLSHRVRHFPQSPGPIIRPRELVDTVLEVPAGFAQAHGWRIGDRVTIDRATP